MTGHVCGCHFSHYAATRARINPVKPCELGIVAVHVARGGIEMANITTKECMRYCMGMACNCITVEGDLPAHTDEALTVLVPRCRFHKKCRVEENHGNIYATSAWRGMTFPFHSGQNDQMLQQKSSLTPSEKLKRATPM